MSWKNHVTIPTLSGQKSTLETKLVRLYVPALKGQKKFNNNNLHQPKMISKYFIVLLRSADHRDRLKNERTKPCHLTAQSFTYALNNIDELTKNLFKTVRLTSSTMLITILTRVFLSFLRSFTKKLLAYFALYRNHGFQDGVCDPYALNNTVLTTGGKTLIDYESVKNWLAGQLTQRSLTEAQLLDGKADAVIHK